MLEFDRQTQPTSHRRLITAIAHSYTVTLGQAQRNLHDLARMRIERDRTNRHVRCAPLRNCAPQKEFGK